MSYSSQRYDLDAAAARKGSQSSSWSRDHRPEQTRRVGLAQIGKKEDVARQAWKVVVTEDQVNAPNPQGMPMPKDKAVVAPREESIFIPTKFIPIQVARGRGPVCEERAKMVTRPDLTPKGKVPLIGKRPGVKTLLGILNIRHGPGMSSKQAGGGSRPGSKRTAEGRYLIQVVDKSRSALNRENGPSYPISLNPSASCDRIASFLAPEKRYAKVLVHWDDGRVQRLDNDISMKDLIRHADFLEVREIKNVHWAA
ncbi:hypothetical protein FSPOR_4917 [Fusarium sporotrichioides]|uniref:Uncharacterized protein n=1 Tax=Fusarium sporotrichioides TaxID=5514 RepID=A0A395SA50_FUSSP|nr:hypothetical protein FSPOR_4917 [Fusarium sporotrichioides]